MTKAEIENLAAKMIAKRLQQGKPTAELQQALNDSKNGRGRVSTVELVMDEYGEG